MSKNLSLDNFLKKGNILHFDKFDFLDGKEDKDKKGRLLVVLQEEMDGEIVFATATSTFKIPIENLKHKCVKPNNKYFRGYLFAKDIIVGGNLNYKFDLDSYVHLNNNPSVFHKTTTYIKETYFDKKRIEFKDVLIKEEYVDFIYCVYHSPHIKNKLKKYLNGELEQILNPKDTPIS